MLTVVRLLFQSSVKVCTRKVKDRNFARVGEFFLTLRINDKLSIFMKDKFPSFKLHTMNFQYVWINLKIFCLINFCGIFRVSQLVWSFQ